MYDSGEAVVLLSGVTEGVATITLNRPARKNAWTYEMEALYFETLDRLADDPEVRAAVLIGAGSAFCPGLDVELLRRDAEGTLVKPAVRRPMIYASSFPKPLVAAINGACAGIGLIQALVCDARFVAKEARLSTAFARRGLVAEHGISWILVRMLGHARAMDLLLSGRTFSGEEACDLGIANHVVPAAEVLAAATDYARDLARHCGPRAMASIKGQVWADWLRTSSESADHARELLADPARRPEMREGAASFAERRPPRFPPLPPAGAR